jgi:DNA-binding NarL/FixJ family response regulator
VIFEYSNNNDATHGVADGSVDQIGVQDASNSRSRSSDEQFAVPYPEMNSRAGVGSGERNLAPADDVTASLPLRLVTDQGPPLDERVLIVDDCTLFRENLVAVLMLNGFQPPAVAWDLPTLVSALQDDRIRILLVNLRTRGSELLMRAALDINAGLRSIALGASEEDETEVVACAEAGVWGYHLRTDSLKDLIVLVHNVAAGTSSCPPRVSAILLRRLSSLATASQPVERELALTSREGQILRMLELGRSNRDIATHLGIAVHTVKNHVHSLLTKLGVSSRAEAAALARSARVDAGSPRRN